MIGIISPLVIAEVTVSADPASKNNLLTPSPREVWLASAAVNHFIDIDLGSIQSFDTAYIGGLSLGIGATWSIQTATGVGVGLGAATTVAVGLSGATTAPYQSLIKLPAPVASRYLRMVITPAVPAELEVGVVAVGLSWQHAYAYGSARPLIDTTRKTDLFDGGFGIDPGVVKSGFRWRFTDLSKVEADSLAAQIRLVGIGKPVIVVEDMTALPPADAELHYGTFDKFEPWERANAVDTIWALSMTEWR